jgi:hypothetical protein
MKRFSLLFIISSWVIYFATGKGVIGSLLLLFSGSYLLIDVLREVEKHAKR